MGHLGFQRLWSGFVIAESAGVYIGQGYKLSSSHAGWNFTTEWSYSLESRDNAKIGIPFDSTNRLAHTKPSFYPHGRTIRTEWPRQSKSQDESTADRGQLSDVDAVVLSLAEN